MRDIYHFKNHFRSDLTAANIGVHKSDWVKARNSDRKEQSHHLMKKGLFDVLPIVNRDNSVTQYWRTIRWGNFSIISDKPELISENDKIYYLTTIKDLIKLFATNQKDFYFLKDIESIVGLVTISHLNYKLIYLYIYELIIEFEMGISRMILTHKVDNLHIENALYSISNSKNLSKIKDSMKRYKADLKTGMNANLIEYLFLSELIQIFIKYRLHIKIGFNNERNLLSIYNSIHKIRNITAHSTKSLVHTKDDVKELYHVIQNIETLNQRIYKFVEK